MAEPSPEGGPTRPTVLVVDDERNIRRTLDLVLRGEGYQVVDAGDAERALEMLELGEAHVDLAILDINLPGMSGVELLQQIRLDPTLRHLPVIVISGQAAREDVARAIKLGAADFFEKPLSRDRVLVSVQNALRASHLAREVAALAAEVGGRHEMIGESPAMIRLYAEIEQVAPTRAGVLVTGETGTGKELVCRALHRRSQRASGPFVKVNCATLPATLIESELFGFERGAFTGAAERKRGLFEVAHGGTLLLDEIGDLDLAAQAKVLRALEYGEITRIGGVHPMRVDVRVLAATHRDLKQAIKAGRFREDLYYRLAVFPIRTPSLAERPEDLAPLAGRFLATFCRENGLPPKTLAADALAELSRRTFPGNVRELKNLVERAAILAEGTVTIADLAEDPHADPFADMPLAPPSSAAGITGTGTGETPEVEVEVVVEEEPVPPTLRGPSPKVAAAPRVSPPAPEKAPEAEPQAVMAVLPPFLPLREARDQAERAHIVEALRRTGWNIRQAASVLEIERTNLHKRIRYFDIQRGEKGEG